MPIMTHRTTFALDEATAQRLRRSAGRWNVSQAEVVRRSRSLPDCMIAATALAAKAPLATKNRNDFAPFLPYGLELI